MSGIEFCRSKCRTYNIHSSKKINNRRKRTSSKARTTSSLLDLSDMTFRSRLESPMTSGSANRSVRALYDRRMPSSRSIIFSSMAWSWDWEEGMLMLLEVGTKALQNTLFGEDEERAMVAATMAVAAVEKDTILLLLFCEMNQPRRFDAFGVMRHSLMIRSTEQIK